MTSMVKVFLIQNFQIVTNADTDIKDIDNDQSCKTVPGIIAEVRALRVNHFTQHFNQSY